MRTSLRNIANTNVLRYGSDFQVPFDIITTITIGTIIHEGNYMFCDVLFICLIRLICMRKFLRPIKLVRIEHEGGSQHC